MSDRKTAYGIRFGETFDGLLISFGADVSCKAHLFEKNEARLLQFSKKMLPAFFMEHVYYVRWRGWCRELLVADCEDFEKLSDSDIHASSSSTREGNHLPDDEQFGSGFLLNK